MTDKTLYGYLVWRKNMRGELVCSKVLFEMMKTSYAKEIAETFISSFPLDENMWAKSLDELSVIFPAPTKPVTQRDTPIKIEGSTDAAN